jgi:hypothetical protein
MSLPTMGRPLAVDVADSRARSLASSAPPFSAVWPLLSAVGAHWAGSPPSLGPGVCSAVFLFGGDV